MGADCKSADESQRWFKSSSAQINDVRHGDPAAPSGVGSSAWRKDYREVGAIDKSIRLI